MPFSHVDQVKWNVALSTLCSSFVKRFSQNFAWAWRLPEIANNLWRSQKKIFLSWFVAHGHRTIACSWQENSVANPTKTTRSAFRRRSHENNENTTPTPAHWSEDPPPLPMTVLYAETEAQSVPLHMAKEIMEVNLLGTNSFTLRRENLRYLPQLHKSPKF